MGGVRVLLDVARPLRSGDAGSDQFLDGCERLAGRRGDGRVLSPDYRCSAWAVPRRSQRWPLSLPGRRVRSSPAPSTSSMVDRSRSDQREEVAPATAVSLTAPRNDERTSGVRSNIRAMIADVEVEDLEATIPFYRELAGDVEVRRFPYRDLELALVGPFLLQGGRRGAGSTDGSTQRHEDRGSPPGRLRLRVPAAPHMTSALRSMRTAHRTFECERLNMMNTKRALVLGGGGVVGTAWMGRARVQMNSPVYWLGSVSTHVRSSSIG